MRQQGNKVGQQQNPEAVGSRRSSAPALAMESQICFPMSATCNGLAHLGHKLVFNHNMSANDDVMVSL